MVRPQVRRSKVSDGLILDVALSVSTITERNVPRRARRSVVFGLRFLAQGAVLLRIRVSIRRMGKSPDASCAGALVALCTASPCGGFTRASVYSDGCVALPERGTLPRPLSSPLGVQGTRRVAEFSEV